MDDGLLVVVDLPGPPAEAPEVRLAEPDRLVVEPDAGGTIDIPLETEGWRIVDQRFANGVLEVELRP